MKFLFYYLIFKNTISNSNIWTEVFKWNSKTYKRFFFFL